MASPSSVETGVPPITVTPGLPSAAELAAYNAARTPQATVALSPISTPGGSTSAGNRAVVPLSAQGGIFAQIKLPPAPSRANTTTTRITHAAAAQPLTVVTLGYNASWAGQLVWVQLLNGGTLTASDAEGTPYTATDGFLLMLSPEGQTTFNYQAPGVSGTYQVLTRLDNVITTLSFLVPDAGQ